MRLRNIVILVAVLLVLGGAFYYLNIPKPAKPQQPRYYAWQINMDNIQHIKMSLPRQGLSQSFIKISSSDVFPWYFDDSKHSAVDQKRWGGGIPLLLSGPGVNRIISKNTPPQILDEYGITNPQMDIELGLSDNTTMDIKVGNKTPDGSAYYVLAPHTDNDVATVDSSWYNVLSGLITDPPYANPQQASANTTGK